MKFYKEHLLMPSEFTYPSSAISSNPSVGVAGQVAPTSATEVAGVGPDGNLHPIATDNSGVVQVADADPTIPRHVIVDSSALPAGASTAANQATEIASLATIATNTTGVATAANQASQTSQLSTIATATAGLNLRTAGAFVPTAFDESAITYIATGNGTGQIGTVTYKLLGTQVKLLTLTYDGSNRLTDVVAT